jgi:gas vesicle protein
MADEGHTWDRVSGLALGIIVGVAAGLLFAPRSGQETRETIRKKAQDSADQLRQAVVDPVVDQLKSTVVDPVVDQGRRLWSHETQLPSASGADASAPAER